METHIPVIYVPTYRDGKDPDKPEVEPRGSMAKKVLKKQREHKKKVEGHENITIAAQAAVTAAAQASAPPDAPDGAATASGEGGDLEGTTGDPEVDDILKASKALTATSDSADEDDEKEVAELERELSRRLEAVESGQPLKHKKHRHHHHHHHHHRHQQQQQQQGQEQAQPQEQMLQRQMEHPSVRRLQSAKSLSGSEKSVSFKEVGI